MSKTLGSLSVGAKIEVPVLSAYQSRFGSKIVFKIADKNHSGYPSNSVPFRRIPTVVPSSPSSLRW